MSSHAKAVSAGSSKRRTGLGRNRIAFASLLALLACAGIGASAASAKIVHPLKEDFGSAAQPIFANPMSLAVDPVGDDLLVVDAGANEKQQLEIKTTSGAVGGTYQLTFGGQTTGWTGTGTVTCNGGSTTITGVTTTTGALVNREQIKSSPGSCIKPGTAITAFNAGAGTITLSQATENNANSGSVSLSSDLAVSGSPSNPTAAQITTSVREALEGLSSVGAGNVTVTGSGNTSPLFRVVEFKNALGATDVDPIVCDGTGLTGTGPTCAITTTSAGAPNGIKRFNADGTPEDFSALGTNVIDGRLGAGAKACGEEISSCDVTPQGFLSFGTQPNSVQVTVDRSGGVTDGDIFVAIAGQNLVNVFASDGHYLGQLNQYRNFSNETQKINLTGTWASGFDEFELGNLPAGCSASSSGPITFFSGGGAFEEAVRTPLRQLCGGATNIGVHGNNREITFSGEFAGVNIPLLTCTTLSGSGTCGLQATVEGGVPSPTTISACGAAVASSGDLYLGGNGVVQRWASSANPPILADNVFNFVNALTGVSQPCNLAAGTAGSAGFLFASGNSGVSKIDPTTGRREYPVASGSTTAVAVNPADGQVLTVAGNVATEYDASGATEATQSSTLTAASAIQGLAVDGPSGNVYVSRAGSGSVEVFGPPAPTPTPVATAATGISPTQATLNGSVDAEGTTVTSCVFEYGPTTAYGQSKPCEGDIPADFSPHPVSVTISGLNPNGATYHYRIVAANSNGSDQSANRSFATASSVATEPASSVANTTATLNGAVNPVGLPLTECKFEYGTALDYGQSKPCDQALGSIEPDFQSHAVSAALTGLAPNTLYHFRFLAKNSSGTVFGADRTFTTRGAPQIVEPQPTEVGQTRATLQARINPSGLSATYHFEWGPAGSNPNRIPADHELFVGSGSELVLVSSELTGLQPASQYQFRVVATNADGTAVSEAQRLETMNANGLPNNRAFELVTPVDKGPAGSVNSGFHNQAGVGAAADGESFLWPLQNGMPGTTAGGWLRLKANRGPDGWTSTQVSSPSLIALPENPTGEIVPPSTMLSRSPDNTCGTLQTFNPLTPDTSATSVELGVNNLYLWRESGDGKVEYRLITDRLPLNPDTAGSIRFYGTVENDDDCSRVYFDSDYKWIANSSGLYEWEASTGALRDAGVRPDGSVGPNLPGLTPPAVFGGEVDSRGTAHWNAVSPSGSHFFFTAISNAGPDSGKAAVFMREDGGESVVDISQSQTAVPTGYARYEAASPDGGKAIFAANYGIAATSSAGPTNGNCDGSSSFNSTKPIEKIPCDLYVYDVETGALTDISADPNPADPIGAAVQGVVAVDEDGSHIYFAALGQLVPGKGRTYAENIAGSGSVNVYLSANGQLTYVTNVTRQVKEVDQLYNGMLMRGIVRAKTNADGTRLLFRSADRQNWYDNGGGAVAYLFDADTRRILCVSCRPDGQATALGASGDLQIDGQALLTFGPRGGPRGQLSADGSRVFFTSTDALAPGAEQGRPNVYEWEEGQVSFLAVAERAGAGGFIPDLAAFLGMSTDGSTAFLATNRKLAPQDRDLIPDVYAVRENGGFPFSEPPPACQVDEAVPLESNQVYCQGERSVASDVGTPASSSFEGAGNPRAVAAGGSNRCIRLARRAQKLAKRAKALRGRASNPQARRRAVRATKGARRSSRAAKRCRQRARQANNDRGGNR